MVNPAQFFTTLASKLRPSIDIQRLGSSQASLRNSTTFGPQANYVNWSKMRGRKATSETIKNQLGGMDS